MGVFCKIFVYRLDVAAIFGLHFKVGKSKRRLLCFSNFPVTVRIFFADSSVVEVSSCQIPAL